jgi:hypothetical protein
VATIKDLLVKLGLDTRDFDDGIDKAGRSVSGLGRSVQALGMLGAGILASGFTAATAGAILLGRELITDVKAAAEAQLVQAQLEAVLLSTGAAAGITAEDVNKLADSLSQLTAFDDEDIVSAQSLLLTFPEITSELFPSATETILDMSTALGQDLSSSAIQLGKALQDPILGVTALRRVGVNFNEAQTDIIKNLVETGRLEEAQAMILKELQVEFGGSARAAGETFAGQLVILQTKLGNIRESVGAELIPVLLRLATTFSEFLSKPETLAFIAAAATGIADFAASVINNLPAAIEWIRMAFGWLVDHQFVIVAAVAVISAAVLTFLLQAAIMAWAAVAPLLPIVAVIILLAGAAYLLYQAWVENFGGIQDKATALWAVVGPILQQWFAWMSNNLQVAIRGLALLWTGVLLPAVMAVWNWINVNLMPLFGAIANVVGAVLKLAFTALVGYIQNVTIPVLSKLWQWFSVHLLPILSAVTAWLVDRLAPGFARISSQIEKLVNWLQTLASKINSIKLPAWLTPGSPTPFELGLLGINAALKKVNATGLPGFSGNMAFGGIGGGGGLSNINIIVHSSGIVDEKDLASKISGAVEVVMRERGYRTG